MRSITAALLPLILVVISGCSWLEDNPQTASLVIQSATAKFIEKADDPSERAQRVIDVSAKALDIVGSERASVDAFRIAVTSLIDFDELPVSDKILLTQLIELVAESLAERVGEGALDPDQLIVVREAFGDAIIAAGYYL